MQKKDIKETIEKHIKMSLRKDEVWHSAYEPDNPHAASDQVTGLDLYLTDVQWAIGANDFEGFEDDIRSFIETEFAQPSLPSSSPIYRYLAREYLKAEAHCIRVSINRARGDYSNETPFAWMPVHLGELDKISKALDGHPLLKRRGRTPMHWSHVRSELGRLHSSGSIEGKSRANISKLLADWYNNKFTTSFDHDTFRKELKADFEQLGY